MNPLVINLQNVNFTIQPSAYATYSKGTCSTKITFISKSGGSPRLSANWQQYFYMVHDITNNQMGFSPYPGVSQLGPSTASLKQLPSYADKRRRRK